MVILGASYCQRATAQSPTLVFGVSSNLDTVVQLDLVASFSQGHFDSLPRGDEDDPRATALRDATFGPGHRYWLYEGGMQRSSLTTTGVVPPACVGLAGAGRPAHTLPAGWAGLAASDSTLRAAATRRALTPDELATLRRAARPLFVALKAPAQVADTAEVLAAWGFATTDTAPVWLTAAFKTRSVDAAGEAMIRAVFLVLNAARGAAPALAWSHAALEDDAQIRIPVDWLDLNHDGQPELFTKTTYSESYDYQIWRRHGTAWTLWLQSAGVGC